MTKVLGFLSIFLLMNFGSIQAQTNQESTQKPTLAFLGTFHFAGSSDLIALKVEDIKSEQKQKEIQDLVNALAKFKPTKVILEYPYHKNRLDSLYQNYLRGEHILSTNESQQIGFRLAKQMEHSHIYPADHRMELPFDQLMTFLQENNRMGEFQDLIEYMKSEVLTQMQQSYDNSTIKEFLTWMNDEKFDKMNKNLYLNSINRMGTTDNYVGTDVVTKWWERNFRIMRHIDEITSPNDRVLVLFGQGHTALLKDFYRGREDVNYEDILNYIKP